jgi:hypothetical protein
MEPLFSIDVIVIIISDYIGQKCKSFLKIINKSDILEYLYTEYDFVSLSDLKIDCNKIRYLTNVTISNTHSLCEYKNLLQIFFPILYNL